MERIKRFFAESWLAKLVSLVLAFSIWYLVKSNLETRHDFPVPGTAPANASRTPGASLEDSILGPLLPAPLPAPLPIPVPGGGPQNRSATLP